MEENEVKIGRWARFKERSKDNYRLVVMNAETFDEVGAYNLTPLNLYILLSTVVLLLSIAIFLLIAYTPLRKYIPGYGDIVERREMSALEDQIEELSGQLEVQREYTENFRRILVGEVTTVQDIESQSKPLEEEDMEAPTLTEEEIRLRREVELERIGQLARGGNNPLVPRAGSSAIPLEQMYLLTPVNGEISAGFKPTEGHIGVDILAPRNTAIKAAAPGVVFMSEFTNANGNVIGIQHENDLITFYKHNSELLKKVGDRVNGGEAVAIIGNTGEMTTGPHLHFELWHRGEVIDPTGYLSF
ncbi:MAG: M23 family metallopeptidase [Bacteroidota bacterium]